MRHCDGSSDMLGGRIAQHVPCRGEERRAAQVLLAP